MVAEAEILSRSIERVVVRDHDGCGLQPLMQIRRQEIAFLVVVVRSVRLQDPQAVADGDAGRDDEEGVAEPLVLGSR